MDFCGGWCWLLSILLYIVSIVWNVPCAQGAGELSLESRVSVLAKVAYAHSIHSPFSLTSNLLKIFILHRCMCLSVYMCIVYADVHRDQKRGCSPLELELTAVVSLCLSSGNPTWVPCKSDKGSCLWAISPGPFSVNLHVKIQNPH